MKALIVKTTASIYICKEHRHKPLHIPAFASHDSYEIYILKTGERNIFIGTKLFSTTACDVSLIKPNVPHRSFGTECSGISIEISSSYLNDFTENKKQHILACFEKHIIALPEDLVEKIWDMKIPDINNEKEKRKYLLEVIDYLLKYSLDTDEREKLTFQNDLSPVGKYIQEQYLKIRGLDEVAQHFNISKSYLCRSFKKRTGLTIITYLNSLRVQYACHLLVETDKSISEISRMCGFDSTIYFTRVFKTIMECTPSQKRKADDTYLY